MIFDGETTMSKFIAKNQGIFDLLGTMICGLCNVVLVLASPAFAAAIQLSAR